MEDRALPGMKEHAAEGVDPLAASDIGSDPENGGIKPVDGRGQIMSGGMSSDADSVLEPGRGGPSSTPQVDGSIGGGEGLDDGGTHGGGTTVLPDEGEAGTAKATRLRDQRRTA